MKVKICIILPLLFIVNLNVLGQAVLLDKTTNQPISYAQILNNKGAVVGTTDIDGNLPKNLSDEIVTIQHIAYNPENVKSSQFKKGKSVFLSPIVCKLMSFEDVRFLILGSEKGKSLACADITIDFAVSPAACLKFL